MTTITTGTAMLSSSSSLLPQQSSSAADGAAAAAATSNTSASSFVGIQRLVWAKYEGTWWWPCLIYQSMSEFESIVGDQLHQSGDMITKARIALDLVDESFANDATPKRSVLQFLGRSLSAYLRVPDDNDTTDESPPPYLDFYRTLGTMVQESICQPRLFDANRRELYLDLHQGLDEAMQLVSASIVGSSSTVSFFQKAQAAWNTHHQDHNDHDEPHHQHQQPPPGSPLGATNSVAAVSLAEDSMMTTTPLRSQTPPLHESSSLSPPPLQTSPIPAGETWDQVWCRMQFSGWVFWMGDGGVRYYKSPRANGNANNTTTLTLEQVQDYAQQQYGWKPPRGQHQRKATTRGGGTPAATSAASKYSFGILWKIHLQPNGWTMIKPKGNKLISYYYMKPSRSLTTGTYGEDYFDSVDQVLDYCAKHSDYPISSPESSEQEPEDESASPSSSSEDSEQSQEDSEQSQEDAEQSEQDETSQEPASTVYDEASLYMTPRDQKTEPQDPGKPLLSSSPSGGSGEDSSSSSSSSSSDPYEWHHLWGRLQTCGWTCIKAKNKLDDWWYVRPGRTPPGLTPGEDYFTLPEQVIQKCKDWDEEEQKDTKAAKRKEAKRSTNHQKEQTSSSSLPSVPLLSKEVEPLKRADKKPKKDKGNGGKPDQRKPADKKPKPNKDDKKANKDKDNGGKPDQRKPANKKQKPNNDNGGKPEQRKRANTKELPPTPNPTPFAVNAQHNTAPWATDCPTIKGLYALCHDVVGICFKTNFYLPGESPKHFTVRFTNLGDIQQHYCQTNSYKLLQETPERQQQFVRWIHYGCVPGRYYDWCQIRLITFDEMCGLLTKAKYCSLKGGGWTRKDSNESYDSLQALCEALRSRDHLEGSSSSSRRRGSSSPSLLTDHEFLALKLRIAEGVDVDHPTSNDAKHPNSSIENPTKKGGCLPKRAPLGPKNGETMPIEEEQETAKSKSNAKHPNDMDIENPTATNGGQTKKRGRPPKRAPLGPKNGETMPVEEDKTTLSKSTERPKKSHKKKHVEAETKKDGDKVEVKVKWDNKLSPNPAPWSINPLPTDSWWPLCKRIGISFKNGYYCVPNIEQTFSLVEVFQHFCTFGGYNLEGLSKEEKQSMKRRISYAHVPETYDSWRRIRELTVEEFATFLDLLGFKKKKNGSWETPAGLSCHLQPRYPSLAALCKALKRVPDLEDCQEEGQRRPQRSATRKSIFNPKHMLALRLFIAEDLITKHDDKSDERDDEGDDRSDEASSASDTDSVEMAEARFQANLKLGQSIISEKEAWRCLQTLGCSYTSGYRVPEGKDRFPNLKDLVQHILDNTVVVLDMESRKLSRLELQKFHRWLKFYHVVIKPTTPVYEALSDMSGDKIDGILQKLGFKLVDGKFYFLGNTSSTGEDLESLVNLSAGQDLESLVNLIRRTKDFADIGTDEESGNGRRRRAKDSRVMPDKLEELTLRIWAAEADYPLLFFCEESFCSENQDTHESPMPVEAEETVPASSPMNDTAPVEDEKTGTSEQMQVEKEIPPPGSEANGELEDQTPLIEENGDKVQGEETGPMHTEDNDPGNTVDGLSNEEKLTCNQTLKEAPMRVEGNQDHFSGEDQAEETDPMQTEDNAPEIKKKSTCDQASEEAHMSVEENEKPLPDACGTEQLAEESTFEHTKKSTRDHASEEAPMRPEGNHNLLSGEDQAEETDPMQTEDNAPEIKKSTCDQASEEAPMSMEENEKPLTDACGTEQPAEEWTFEHTGENDSRANNEGDDSMQCHLSYENNTVPPEEQPKDTDANNGTNHDAWNSNFMTQEPLENDDSEETILRCDRPAGVSVSLATDVEHHIDATEDFIFQNPGLPFMTQDFEDCHW